MNPTPASVAHYSRAKASFGNWRLLLAIAVNVGLWAVILDVAGRVIP